MLVLCYHAISPAWPAELSVTPANFERQVHTLLERGYVGTTFSEAVAGAAAPKTVALTFDDGYRSVLDRALPILRRLGLPATLFVSTNFVDTAQPLVWPGIDRWLDSPHHAELFGLSWEELRYLADEGWEIGSHTCSHPRLPQLDDAALAAELEGSRAICERRLGQPCRSIAYPYGNVDARVMAATRTAGYSAAAALPHAGWHHHDPLRWPRVGVYHDHGERRFKRGISPWVRSVAASPAWPLLSRGARMARRLRRSRAAGPT